MLLPQFERTVSRALPDLCGAWVPLVGGRTNRLWRVGDTVVKQYIPEAASPLFPNDTGSEVAALSLFAPLGLAPRLRAHGIGWLAYSHVPGERWQADTSIVARLLGTLHHLKVSDPVFRKLACSTQALHDQTAALMQEAGLTAAMPSVPILMPGPVCVIHGDAVAGNIIMSPSGPCLVDWQCPAWGDPAEDISTFLSPAMQTLYRGSPLSTAEVDSFLAAYPDKAVCARYLALRPLFRLRIAAHCLWRARRGDTGFAQAARAELAA